MVVHVGMLVFMHAIACTASPMLHSMQLASSQPTLAPPFPAPHPSPRSGR